MIDIMRQEIDRFGDWYDDPKKRRKRRVPALQEEARDNFLHSTRTWEWRSQLLVACQTRSFKKADRASLASPPTRETVQAYLEAIDKMDCYACVYTQYLVRLLTDRALPDPNDSGDLELFLYLVDDDHVLATCERKWKRLADRAGYGHRVRLLIT
jgi:hypothetical protein